jgi:hypothetical protein
MVRLGMFHSPWTSYLGLDGKGRIAGEQATFPKPQTATAP